MNVNGRIPPDLLDITCTCSGLLPAAAAACWPPCLSPVPVPRPATTPLPYSLAASAGCWQVVYDTFEDIMRQAPVPFCECAADSCSALLCPLHQLCCRLAAMLRLLVLRLPYAMPLPPTISVPCAPAASMPQTRSWPTLAWSVALRWRRTLRTCSSSGACRRPWRQRTALATATPSGC